MGAQCFIAAFSADLPALLSLARNLTPRLELCPPDGVILEIGLCETPRIMEQLRRHSPSVRLGAAGTRNAALLAAKASAECVIPPGREAECLADFPVDVLAFLDEAADENFHLTLLRWGIRTLGQFASLPSDELAARLGQPGIRLQRLARGEDLEPLQACPPTQCFEDSLELEYSLDSLEPLNFLVSQSLDRLCEELRSRGLAAQAVRLSLKLETYDVYQRRVSLAFPSQQPKTLLSLLRLDLQTHPPQAGITALTVRLEPAPPRALQYSLFTPVALNPEKLARTLARLYVLVGEGNVGSPILEDTHRPDAFQIVGFGPPEDRNSGPEAQGGSRQAARNAKRPRDPSGYDAGGGVRRASSRTGSLFDDIGTGSGRATPPPAHPLPPGRLSLRRFRPPAPIRLRKRQTVAWAGPWRCSGDWWKETVWAREEWDVELTDGSVYRVFCDPEHRSWFAEGVYD
jgi:protein ImuB